MYTAQARRRVPYKGYRGVLLPQGMGATAEQTVGTISGLGTPILTGALAASAASSAATGAAGAGLILGMSPALAIPIIGAAMVGVTIAVIGLIKLSKGCGQTCIATSQWANQAEDLLKQNLAAYLALPVPRPRSAQNTAISNYNVVVARLTQMCSDPATGAAGQRCISDRAAGACVWRDASGACWNWVTGYLDPIASDPNVVDDSIAGQAGTAWSSAVQGGSLPLLLGAGLIVAAVMLL